MESCISAKFCRGHQGGHLSSPSKYFRLACCHAVLVCALQWLAWVVLWLSCNTNSGFFWSVSLVHLCSWILVSQLTLAIPDSKQHRLQEADLSSKMPVAKGAVPKVSVSQAVTLNQLLFWTKCPSGALGALLVQNQICRTYSPWEIMRMHFLWKHIPGEN